jgi:hypothetical protein
MPVTTSHRPAYNHSSGLEPPFTLRQKKTQRITALGLFAFSLISL